MSNCSDQNDIMCLQTNKSIRELNIAAFLPCKLYLTFPCVSQVRKSVLYYLHNLLFCTNFPTVNQTLCCNQQSALIFSCFESIIRTSLNTTITSQTEKKKHDATGNKLWARKNIFLKQLFTQPLVNSGHILFSIAMFPHAVHASAPLSLS